MHHLYSSIHISVLTAFDVFQNCVLPLGGSSMDGFSAIKMTALGRPQFLVGTKAWLTGQCTGLADTLVTEMRWADMLHVFIFPSKLQFSEVLMKWKRFFTFLSSQQGKDGMDALEQKLDLKQLQVEFFLLRLTWWCHSVRMLLQIFILYVKCSTLDFSTVSIYCRNSWPNWVQKVATMAGLLEEKRYHQGKHEYRLLK